MAKVVVRKARKELWMWRILFISSISYFFVTRDSNQQQEIKEDSIVRTELYGNIFYNDEVLNNIYSLADNDNVKGVLLKVNCPGGEITASEALYKAFKEVRAKKPLVVSVMSSAASGGYMASLPANKIYAYESSIVGSIGVVTGGFLDISGLEEKLGIKFFNYKTSPLKALPDYYSLLGLDLFKKPSEEGDKHIQEGIDETQGIFIDFVKENRPQIKDLSLVTNGKEFIGRKGLQLGLIDAIGTERDALNDLQTNFNIKSDLPVVDYQIIPNSEEKGGFFGKILSFARLFSRS